MNPFQDYIPDPPSLDVFDYEINRFDITIKAFERLEKKGLLNGSVAVEYYRGIQEIWEARRSGTIRQYARELPKNLQELKSMRDSLRQCANQARLENNEIINSIARDLENGNDAPIALGCLDDHIAILDHRIARIEAAIDFLTDNL